MTKEQALEITRKKFTNLFGGDILPGVSVSKIISYYESLIKNEKPDNTMPIGGIERNFREEEIEDDLFYLRNGFLP
tara:strand:+ start:5586 stop:5813 length:228 start_codon:yes stop_codon:yes gene_type:complete